MGNFLKQKFTFKEVEVILYKHFSRHTIKGKKKERDNVHVVTRKKCFSDNENSQQNLIVLKNCKVLSLISCHLC